MIVFCYIEGFHPLKSRHFHLQRKGAIDAVYYVAIELNELSVNLVQLLGNNHDKGDFIQTSAIEEKRHE